jgi:Ser/Thr protein kinase RdoA (MazF antagonist)
MAVIAKRTRSAHVEQTIYEEILPHLPISRLICYGCADEPETGYGWLFLEDARGEEFAYSIEKNRRLAARWLGQMHISAARIPAVSRLPDHGPKKYLDRLRSSRELIQRNLGNPALKSPDLQVLEAILSQGHFLESRWNRVEELCHRFPRTLVHGDFSIYNLAVRSGSGTNLVAFDWGKAGYGIPAHDIAGASPWAQGNSAITNSVLGDYWSVVQESWSDLDLSAIKELADLGAVFHLLACIRWGNECIACGWWPIEKIEVLHRYQVDLTVVLEHLGFAR